MASTNPILRIHLDGDRCWPDLRGKLGTDRVIDAGAQMEIAALPGGMHSGRTSVTFRIDLPDGRTVLAQTSLALLGTAVDGLRARYPGG